MFFAYLFKWGLWIVELFTQLRRLRKSPQKMGWLPMGYEIRITSWLSDQGMREAA
jgi:hypothetical protein